MTEKSGGSRKRYGIIAVCGALALAVIVGAYWMGRSAGTGKDVGEETAKAAALGHAQVSESGLSRFEITRDESGGVLVYEVKFTADGVDYDYEISAATGNVVKFSREADGSAPEPVQDVPAPETEDIGEERAWEIAYAHAGVAAGDAAASPAKVDYDGGALVYELEFFSGGYEYDYEISAAGGSILKSEKEADGRTAPPQASAGNASGDAAYIGEARAREIAYAHAGVTAGNVLHCEVELDHHDGHGVHHGAECCAYEIEFKCGGYEYDYEVDAVTGEILKSQQELDD